FGRGLAETRQKEKTCCTATTWWSAPAPRPSRSSTRSSTSPRPPSPSSTGGTCPEGTGTTPTPFVQLHQPARMYGIASVPFGDVGIAQVGSNRGLAPLASGAQVSSHFHQFMRETLLQSGRVTYLPLTEYRGGGECVSLLSGEVTRVSAPV